MDNGGISVMMHHLVSMKPMLFVTNLVGVELVPTPLVNMMGKSPPKVCLIYDGHFI